jgi:hypothetical protein
VPELSFDQLQTRLVPLWKSIERMSQDEQTIVVVPALTVDSPDLKGAKLQAYEERFLLCACELHHAVSALSASPHAEPRESGQGQGIAPRRSTHD